MIKIVHGADFHLDSPFAGLPPEKARQRRAESRELLYRLLELVRQEQSDLLLLSGDLFDSGEIFPETIATLSRVLSAMPCPVCIAPGNHDPYTASGPYAGISWGENVHIFTSQQMESVDFPHLNCVVHGCAFTESTSLRHPLEHFSAPQDGKLHLLCLHGDMGAEHSSYAPITRQELLRSGVTYAALGHIHQCSGFQRCGDTCWAYPGCPEGRGFDETGDKGVLVGTIEAGQVRLAFVPLCRRRYRLLQASVTGTTYRQALESVLAPEVAEDVCRVTFIGEAEETGVDLNHLQSAFSRRCFQLQLEDNTHIAEGLWDRAGEDSLRGLFLQEMNRRFNAAAEDGERRLVEEAVRLGLAAMDGRDIT